MPTGRNAGPRIAVNPGMETAENALAKRIEGLRAWLEANAPDCFDDQLHTEEGTPERAYWHYGYLVALRDMRSLLFERDGEHN